MSENIILPEQADEEHKAILADFYNYIVRHTILDGVGEEVQLDIDYPTREKMSTVVGPSGVGKSTLQDHIASKIIKREMAKLNADPGRIPVVMVRAPATETGHFVFKDFNCRFLDAANEPLISKKIKEDHCKEMLVPSHELRRALEKTLKNRKPVIAMVDEAQRMAIAGSGRTLLNQLDWCKHLTQESETILLITGTYKLLDFLGLDSQFTRRAWNFHHFRRYNGHDENDRKDFLRIIKTFLARMPLPFSLPPKDLEEYLFTRSIGCVGILKDWLYRALTYALKEGANHLTKSHLDRAKLSDKVLMEMAKEALEGEARLKDSANAGVMLDGLWSSDGSGNTKKSSDSVPKAPFDQKMPQLTKGNRRPGQRNPKRDPVGLPDGGMFDP